MSLPEGARRAKDGAAPDAGSPEAAALRAVNGSGKFDGVEAKGELQRLGDDAGSPPVQRRAVGTRPVDRDNEEGTEEVERDAAARTAAPPVGSPPTTKRASADSDGLASTGISGLDAQYGGGLPVGSLFLLTSEPTTATGVFAAQYAGAGLSAGETVYYFSLEQPAASVRKAIGSFVDAEKDLERLHIIDGYPGQFTDVPEEAKKRIGVAKGQNALASLESLLVDPRVKGPVRIIVESLTELLSQYDEDRVFRVLRVLRGVAGTLPATAVVTMVTPLHDDRTVYQAKHIADGVIEFHVERKGFGIYPYIAVTKMRGVTGSARLLLFKETETGLWLESTKRVF